MVRVWRFTGWELAALIGIGVITPLLDHRLQNTLFQFLFGIPSVVTFTNYVVSSTGGPVFGDLLMTWEQYGGVLAGFLVRKPGAGTIAMTINGFGQVFLNGTHSPHLLYGVAGLGADIAFAFFGYKRYDVRVVGLAGVFAGLFWYPIVFVTHGVYFYSASFILIDFFVRLLGSAIGNGLLGATIGIAIMGAVRRSGLLFQGAGIKTMKQGRGLHPEARDCVLPNLSVD